nr:inter-alpha-trypsin inhibitor heavy chain H3 isoform X1 [Dasypus novemcinctus]
MAPVLRSCLVLALLSGLGASSILRSPLWPLGKRSLPEGVVDGIEVYSTKIKCQVTSRFAHNVVTTRAVNRADKAKEVSFDVELPKTAFITNFTLTIDGVTYPGNVKEKEVAQKQYEKAVSQGKTAGLVKASGRKLEKFTVSVNVAAGSKVTFELTYEELLKRHKGKYEMYLKVQPKQLVKDFEIEADIFEPQGISMLDAEASFITNDLLGSALTKSFSGKKGRVSFKPSLEQQRSCPTCTDSLLNGDFTITYDVNRESPANVQVVNGYFVHFFAPQGLPVVPKSVAFVIDVSGSMAGRKIQQTRDALLKILEDMREEDYLNFILFSGGVTTWKDNLVQATPENLQEAKAFVKSITDQGSTNINDGLLRGIEMLNKAREEHKVPERSTSIVIMLTDGDANTGESRPEKIQENVRNAIGGKFPLYNLGFGTNLNYNFLENMALENNGFARRIYEDSDANLQLQGFYEEVANPLLTGVELEYPENAILDLTQNNYQHFYDGSEIVVAGRLLDEDAAHFKADVKGHGATNDLTFTEEVDMKEMEKALQEREYIFGNYIERLWAYLTIEQLLEKRKNARGEEKENLTAQALDLSLKYHFVTPLTSMVVTKPEDNEDRTAIADKPGEGGRGQRGRRLPCGSPGPGGAGPGRAAQTCWGGAGAGRKHGRKGRGAPWCGESEELSTWTVGWGSVEGAPGPGAPGGAQLAAGRSLARAGLARDKLWKPLGLRRCQRPTAPDALLRFLPRDATGCRSQVCGPLHSLPDQLPASTNTLLLRGRGPPLHHPSPRERRRPLLQHRRGPRHSAAPHPGPRHRPHG